MLGIRPGPRQRGTRCCGPKYRPSISQADASMLAQRLDALGDQIRLRIVSMLARHGGEVCVCDIVEMFDLGQPTISHHLGVLRDAGIVAVTRRGIWAYYAVERGALKSVRECLGSMF